MCAVVATPDERLPDSSDATREQFWRRGIGPAAWLVVIVDWSSAPGNVVTAYGTHRTPNGW
jgi:hypothetical protein